MNISKQRRFCLDKWRRLVSVDVILALTHGTRHWLASVATYGRPIERWSLSLCVCVCVCEEEEAKHKVVQVVVGQVCVVYIDTVCCLMTVPERSPTPYLIEMHILSDQYRVLPMGGLWRDDFVGSSSRVPTVVIHNCLQWAESVEDDVFSVIKYIDTPSNDRKARIRSYTTRILSETFHDIFCQFFSLCMHIRTHTHKYMHADTHTHKYIYIYINVHAYLHTYIHTYIHEEYYWY